jgi:hypothetical protein
LKKAQESRDAQQKESDRLRNELGKKAFLGQANLKKIVDKFREQRNVAIQAATATALQGWIRPTEIFRDPNSRSWIRRIAR